ncbi:hypothetical protein R3P38DRAFT_3209894 [Favolaschia claudopus]|uniref:Uncharacterized protein n=1 Tax=Favolaschia claudopus TaxID=2862362 RepID=A0AAW0AIM8_9AGAR
MTVKVRNYDCGGAQQSFVLPLLGYMAMTVGCFYFINLTGQLCSSDTLLGLLPKPSSYRRYAQLLVEFVALASMEFWLLISLVWSGLGSYLMDDNAAAC